MDSGEILTEITLRESDGHSRRKEPVSLGVPMPQGLVYDPDQLSLSQKGCSDGPSLQAHPLGRWPGGSLKWVLLDFNVSLNAGETVVLHLSMENTISRGPFLSIEPGKGRLAVNTNDAHFSLPAHGEFRFSAEICGQGSFLGESGISCRLTGESEDMVHSPQIYAHEIVCQGPVRTEIAWTGGFESRTGETPVDFEAHLHLWRGSGMARLDFSIANPATARHPGGLWDLGDPGSFLFRDLSFHVAAPSGGEWDGLYRTQSRNPLRNASLDGENGLRIYQDSSGGRNWRSPNHVNRHGEIPISFQGYRVFRGDEIAENGPRATPFVAWNGPNGAVGVGVFQFWQNFPKSLDMNADGVRVGLFPGCFGDLHELQGGERKTHTLYFFFSKNGILEDELSWIDCPLAPVLPPEWYEKAEAFPCFSASNSYPNSRIPQLFDSVISGERSFFQRREEIDEYGWRHFGDLYADHESVNHQGSEPFISHYNNQYDCLYGMLFQFAGTGRPEWYRLANDLARHLADIDIYHTRLDRPEYNRGLFWHTDHYRPAGTATHRAFTRANVPPEGGYGGGPSLSHLYSTGFLYHHWMTGSPHSRQSALDLARFAGENLEMENRALNHALRGARRLKSELQARVHGGELVRLIKVYELDGPGRASGNTLAALMNGYRLTGDPSFRKQAESLIRRCVHPRDDLARRDLGDVENRWMYTVFLQALGDYLDMSREDWADEEFSAQGMWAYARESLLHYADWMVENEFPYLSRPEKLEYPNETWAAQEIRKTNVLLYAVRYASGPAKRERYWERAHYFFREAIGRLFEFDTHSLTRPVALLLQNAEMVRAFGTDLSLDQSLDFVPHSSNRPHPRFRLVPHLLRSFSFQKEINFFRWRIRK
jgi:hypothetical protein